MIFKVYIGGRFKFATLINGLDLEYDAEHEALMDFYQRHPDIEVEDIQFSVEKVEEPNEEDEKR